MTLKFIDGFSHYATADIDLKYNIHTGSPTIATSAGRNGGGALSYAASQYVTKIIGTTTTWIVGFAIKFSSLGSTARELFILIDSDNTTQCSLRMNTNGTFSLFRGTSAGTLLGTSVFAFSTGTWYYVEIKITVDTSGSYDIHVNAVSKLSGTGNTSNSGVTGASQLRLGDFGGNGHVGLICDLYICDGLGSTNNDFLGDCKIETLFPIGVGNYSQFTRLTGSTNYSNVDDATPNSDTDYNYSSTINQIDTYTYTDLSSTPISIFGVQINNIARKDDGGSRVVAPIIRLASTDYVQSNIGLSYNYTLQIQIMESGPVTSWSTADINAMECGLKVIS